MDQSQKSYHDSEAIIRLEATQETKIQLDIFLIGQCVPNLKTFQRNEYTEWCLWIQTRNQMKFQKIPFFLETLQSVLNLTTCAFSFLRWSLYFVDDLQCGYLALHYIKHYKTATTKCGVNICRRSFRTDFAVLGVSFTGIQQLSSPKLAWWEESAQAQVLEKITKSSPESSY